MSRVVEGVATTARRWRPALLLACVLLTAAMSGAIAEEPVSGRAPEPSPLSDIVAREQARDPWSLPVVSIRCTSFYISASAVEKEERPAIADQYEENAERFLARLLALSDDNKERLIAQMTRLSRMYYVLSLSALEASGDPMEHPLLRADFDFCARLARQA